MPDDDRQVAPAAVLATPAVPGAPGTGQLALIAGLTTATSSAGEWSAFFV